MALKLFDNCVKKAAIAIDPCVLAKSEIVYTPTYWAFIRNAQLSKNSCKSSSNWHTNWL